MASKKRNSDEVIIKIKDEFFYGQILHRNIPDGRVLKHCCYVNGWGEEWILPQNIFPTTKANIALMSEIFSTKLEHEKILKRLRRKMKRSEDI